MKTTIIGAGEIGSAIARLIQTSGNEVELWDANQQLVPYQKPIEQLLPSSEAIFLCIPSWVLRVSLTQNAQLIPKTAVVIALAKGIEKETNKTMDQVMKEELGSEQQIALLGGPMLAEELNLGLLGVGVVATKKLETFKLIQTLFNGSNIRLEWVDDLRLVALQSVLKNIYSVGLGIADGLEWGFNAKGWFAAMSLREINDVIELIHDKKCSAIQTAGAGDFIATAFSPYSKNREFGHAIVKTGNCDLKSEGCVSLPQIINLLGDKISKLSIMSAINKILYEKSNAKTEFENLIKNV